MPQLTSVHILPYHFMPFIMAIMTSVWISLDSSVFPLERECGRACDCRVLSTVLSSRSCLGPGWRPLCRVIVGTSVQEDSWVVRGLRGSWGGHWVASNAPPPSTRACRVSSRLRKKDHGHGSDVSCGQCCLGDMEVDVMIKSLARWFGTQGTWDWRYRPGNSLASLWYWNELMTLREYSQGDNVFVTGASILTSSSFPVCQLRLLLLASSSCDQ